VLVVFSEDVSATRPYRRGFWEVYGGLNVWAFSSDCTKLCS